jgi:hypothetical protein
MLLGVAFKDFLAPSKANTPLFPAVGLRTPQEVVEINFGAKPFKFDILQYCRVDSRNTGRKGKACTDAQEHANCQEHETS